MTASKALIIMVELESKNYFIFGPSEQSFPGPSLPYGMRPIILPQFFPKANLGNLPAEVDTIIRGIIDKSK